MSSEMGEAKHNDWSWEDNERRLVETRRWMDAQHALACRRQERQERRQERRVLGFIPGDVWELWPTLIMTSTIGGLLGFGVSELLVHHISLAAVCR